MAIVLFDSRPALRVENGSFAAPGEPWAHLGDAAVRPRLDAAITAVGRLEDESQALFLGTAFAVGPNLAITAALPPHAAEQLFIAFRDGERVPVRRQVALTISDIPCALLNLNLPDGVKPLQLSKLDPDSLAGREIVAIGYPASATRNDPAAVQRIFGGVFGVKQLLPGRVTGRDEQGSLQHDASTLVGCGGAPLVDVETGEVVGIHYGGAYLESNLALPAPKVAKSIDAATRGHRGPAVKPPFGMTVDGSRTAVPEIATPQEVEQAAAPAADAPEGQPPIPQSVPTDRPTVTARDWRNSLTGPWRELLTPHEFRIDTAVRAVGRVLSGTTADAWSGTAFVVGDRLALTSSEVARAFTDGSGLRVTIRDGCTPAVDFADALGADAGTATIAVTGVKFIHPCFHVALLELAETPSGTTRLELAARMPANLSGRPVVLVSYALPGQLRVQPGQALQVGELPDASRLPALAYDCSSETGSAGGPVVDLGTGYVIGLHSHRRTGDGVNGGFAQPPWELARDPVLWGQSLGFRPDPQPPWLAQWGAVAAVPIPAAVPVPAAAGPGTVPPPPQHWTVDWIPIDWTLQEPKDLQKLLTLSIDAESALFEAENVGLPLGRVSRGLAPELLWRELLKTAANAGLLRRFLEYLTSQSQYEGIATQLRTYL